MGKIIKKDFENINEIMQSLPRETREHSLRTAELMKIIFTQSLDMFLYQSDPKTTVRLKEENLRLAYYSALYHDIGKVLLPAEYQFSLPDFTEEEETLYRTHAAKSAELLEKYLATSDEEFDYRDKSFIIEAVTNHHENWEGSGYPTGIAGRNVTVFARMVRLCDDIDRYVFRNHSETPLEDCAEALKAGGDSLYDPELVRVFFKSEKKIKRYFESVKEKPYYVEPIIPFCKSGKKPKMEMLYRPVSNRKDGSLAGIKASLKFSIKGDERLDYTAVEDILKRDVKMMKDLTVVSSLCGCDMLRRLDRAEIECPFIILSLPDSAIKRAGMAKDIIAAAEDSLIPCERLSVEVTGDDVFGMKATPLGNISKLRQAGCPVILRDFKIKDCYKEPEIPLTDDEIYAEILAEKEENEKAENEISEINEIAEINEVSEITEVSEINELSEKAEAVTEKDTVRADTAEETAEIPVIAEEVVFVENNENDENNESIESNESNENNGDDGNNDGAEEIKTADDKISEAKVTQKKQIKRECDFSPYLSTEEIIRIAPTFVMLTKYDADSLKDNDYIAEIMKLRDSGIRVIAENIFGEEEEKTLDYFDCEIRISDSDGYYTDGTQFVKTYIKR